MKHFNNEQPYSNELILKFRFHFAYKWEKDLNQFIESDEDKKILAQLPEET